MRMRLEKIPTYLDENITRYINTILETTIEDDFDEEVFNEWLFRVDVEHKNNPSGYVRSCFKKELEAGTFKPKTKLDFIPNIQVLINELRDRGVCVMADESVWLSVVWKHIVNWQNVDIKDCRQVNRTIIANLGKNKSFEEYKTSLKNSPLLKKYNINWALLEEKVKMEILGWNKYLDSLESEE